MLTLIPKTINGIVLTLKSFKVLLNQTWRYSLNQTVAQVHGDTAIDSSYWVLMTKKEISLTKKNSEFVESQNYVSNVAGKDGYTLPHAIDATISVFMNFICENVEIMKHWSLRCPEMVDVRNVSYAGKYPVSVTLMKDHTNWLSVRDGSLGNSLYTVAASRRL